MDILLYKDGRIVCADNPLHESLDNLAMIATNPQNGDTLKYDSSSGTWINGAGGGDFNPTISNPQDGDTLVYNSSTGKWENGAGGGGGAVKLTVTQTTSGDVDIYTLDKTWQEIHDAVNSGSIVVLTGEDSDEALHQFYVWYVYESGGDYGIADTDFNGGSYIETILGGSGQFKASSANGYPSKTL